MFVTKRRLGIECRELMSNIISLRDSIRSELDLFVRRNELPELKARIYHLERLLKYQKKEPSPCSEISIDIGEAVRTYHDGVVTETKKAKKK